MTDKMALYRDSCFPTCKKIKVNKVAFVDLSETTPLDPPLPLRAVVYGDNLVSSRNNRYRSQSEILATVLYDIVGIHFLWHSSPASTCDALQTDARLKQMHTHNLETWQR